MQPPERSSQQIAERMLADAGFSAVDARPLPLTQQPAEEEPPASGDDADNVIDGFGEVYLDPFEALDVPRNSDLEEPPPPPPPLPSPTAVPESPAQTESAWLGGEREASPPAHGAAGDDGAEPFEARSGSWLDEPEDEPELHRQSVSESPMARRGGSRPRVLDDAQRALPVARLSPGGRLVPLVVLIVAFALVMVVARPGHERQLASPSTTPPPSAPARRPTVARPVSPAPTAGLQPALAHRPRPQRPARRRDPRPAGLTARRATRGSEGSRASQPRVPRTVAAPVSIAVTKEPVAAPRGSRAPRRAAAVTEWSGEFTP